MEVQVSVEAAIQYLLKLEFDARKAVETAVRETAEGVALPAMRSALSFAGERAPIGQLRTNTGKLRSQVRPKFWIGRDGLLNAAVKVVGDRAHIARFHETGTKSHGRQAGPLPARRMFAIVGAAIRPHIERALLQSFERQLTART